MSSVRVDLGENAQIPDICCACGQIEPARQVMLRLRQPILVHGRIMHRTMQVSVGYCSPCFTRIRRFDPAARLVWTGCAVLAAGLLLVQLGLPRSDDVLALRAALPWVALGLLGLAGLTNIWLNSLMTSRFPVRLVDFNVHGYTLAFDNAEVAAAVERANRPTPAAAASW